MEGDAYAGAVTDRRDHRYRTSLNMCICTHVHADSSGSQILFCQYCNAFHLLALALIAATSNFLIRNLLRLLAFHSYASPHSQARFSNSFQIGSGYISII